LAPVIVGIDKAVKTKTNNKVIFFIKFILYYYLMIKQMDNRGVIELLSIEMIALVSALLFDQFFIYRKVVLFLQPAIDLINKLLAS
jgi:hypothetical protein